MGKTWTPEPWFITGMDLLKDPNDETSVRSHRFVVSQDDTWICEMIQDGESAYRDAERIAACVNACSTMPDPAKAVELAVKAMRNALVVLWDGDPRRQADCEVCIALRQALAAYGEEAQRG